jgi:hypothetical protein
MDVSTDDINGTRVYRPKDLASLRNRMIFQVETRFPKAFYWVKRTAVKHMISKK